MTKFVVAAIALLTTLAYYGVGECGFVNLDDDAYVEFQPMVTQGMRSPGVAWAFTGSHSGNWHPVTTLSHMLDVEVFGVRAAPMHWENVVWHLLNSVLVFVVWRALTAATWRSAIVAALFALHPLHVESVAWISERKDVLSAFFWLLGIAAYARYVSKPTLARYALVAGAMVLALLSKPMAVTFPFTLLLLDFWPLVRWQERTWRSLLLEKIPLLVIAGAHGVLTFLVQNAGGASAYGQRFPLSARIGNAVVAYLRYLRKTVWPQSLSPLYFHPGFWPGWHVAGSAVVLLAVSALVAWRWRREPWLGFGWVWFLGTLVPVIGILQVGAQSMADRYMYVPILGLFTAGTWQVAKLAQDRPRSQPWLLAATAVALIGLTVTTVRQVSAWRNSIALYEHSIAVGEDNAAIRYLLAVALAAAGRPETEVVAQYKRALELQPDYVNAMTQLAAIAISHQRMDEARALVEQELRLEPNNPGIHANQGAIWRRLGRPDDARKEYEEVLRLDPKSSAAHLEIGQMLIEQNRLVEAEHHYQARARLDRWNAEAQCDYGTLLGNLGRLADARRFLERALWLKPDLERAQTNLEVVKTLQTQP